MGAACPPGARLSAGPLPRDLVWETCDGDVEVDYEQLVAHALRSWAAYQSEVEVRSGKFNACRQRIYGPESSSRSCFNLHAEFWSLFGDFPLVLEHLRDGGHWIAIRGTEDIGNIVSNLFTNLVWVPELGIKAHAGYAELSARAFAKLFPFLDRWESIRLTGHSLGGAIAHLLALRFAVAGLSVAEVVTFGAPQVTDAAGRHAFKDLPILRVTTGTDPAPACPPTGGYVQVGQELRLNGDTDNGVWMPENPLSVNLFGLPDHQLTTYLSYLNARTPRPSAGLQAALSTM
eukprot:EG_transcript_17097